MNKLFDSRYLNISEEITLDIENSQKLEIQRKNFFAAVSHELKTPLTIIKGQIENMMLGFGDYKNHDKYLPEALQSADDIEHLLKEILSITKIETMNIEDSEEDISLLLLVSGVIQNLTPLAEEKEIEIICDISNECVVTVNKNLFSKSISNIVGNAIRYAQNKARIDITWNANKQILVIENTGSHISDEDLEQIFTPFYRADKSRNNQLDTREWQTKLDMPTQSPTNIEKTPI